MNERRIAVLAARDVLVVSVAAWLVHLDAVLRPTGSPMVLAIATGVLITVSGFYAHEWGHYLAARFAGAKPVPSASPLSIYLFELDENACTRRQWLTMSAGGYLATLVALPIILSIIDVHVLSGQVALVLTSLGVLATFGLELPITYRVYRKPTEA